jgi:hypothetical protein
MWCPCHRDTPPTCQQVSRPLTAQIAVGPAAPTGRLDERAQLAPPRACSCSTPPSNEKASGATAATVPRRPRAAKVPWRQGPAAARPLHKGSGGQPQGQRVVLQGCLDAERTAVPRTPAPQAYFIQWPR